ncbi:MAG TPA: hypothetical protein DGG95_13450 [Cytophagales bacterium]|jgi:hypothetical protein|nr:hypothetical protein [Cytophagales bacterium]
MILKKILASGLVIGCFAFNANEDFISIVKSKSSNYFNKIDRVKLELILNQPKYVPGDTIIIRSLYLKATDLKPVMGTQVVHVALFDQNGKIELTRFFSITNGVSTNKLVLPKELTTGKYTLLAFTEWMKNLDQALFYKQDFIVAGSKLLRKIVKDTIEFYPEGGRLLSGLPNNIAFRYSGQKERVTVSVKSSEGELAKLELKRDSVSIFKLTPVARKQYYVDLTGTTFLLPSQTEKGIAIDIKASKTETSIRLEKTDGLDLSEVYLLMFNSTGLIYQTKVDFNAKQVELLLPQNLPSGIKQMMVVDSNFTPWAERVLYSDSGPSAFLELNNLNSNYLTRQAVSMDLKIKSADGYQKAGSYFVRVLNADLFPNEEMLMDYLTFQSDISNTFGLKRKYANQVTINNYLITQTCPWFDWKKVIDNNLSMLHKHEEYMTLSGRAVYAANNQPIKDSTLLMFYLTHNLKGYETYATTKGTFSFPLVLSVNSNDQFFFTSSFKGNDGDEIKIKILDLDSMVKLNPKSNYVEEGIDPFFVYQSQRNSINNSYSFFLGQKTIQDSTFDANRPFEDELSGPDATVELTDFLQMPSMQEILKEIVKSVEYRKINGRHVVRVYTTLKKPNNHTGPLYIIDGQFTKNPEIFLSLKPTEVINIKLFKDSRKLFALGQLGSNGVIMVKTKRGKIINERNVIGFTGMLPRTDQPIFKERVNPSIPNLRSCLFWEGKGKFSDAELTHIQFNTSDDVGKFRLQLFGLLDNGISLFEEKVFEVKFAKN